MLHAFKMMPEVTLPLVYGALGLVAGGAAAYAYRLLPTPWLCDYDEAPEAHHARQQRCLPAWALAAFALLAAVCGAGLAAADGAAAWAAGVEGAGEPAALWPLLLLLRALPGACLVATLLLAALCDAQYTILPDELLLLAAAFTLWLWAAGGLRGVHSAWYSLFLGAAIGFFGLWLVQAVASKCYKTEAMGFGDVKLLAVLGALCGPRALGVAALLAVLSAGLILGVGLLCGKLTRRSAAPFGPFLVAGALGAVCLWPQWCALGTWYLSLYGL